MVEMADYSVSKLMHPAMRMEVEWLRRLCTTGEIRRFFVIGVILLAFSLRTCQLGHQELRGDEAFGYFFSLQPISEIVAQTIELAEPHPVASYFVFHFWLNWAGHSEYALRFVSVWFGVLAVVLLIRLGYSLRLSTRAALCIGLLLAMSPYAVWHSQDARMYGMSLALTIASSWLAVDILGRRNYELDRSAAYVCVTLLALHTYYFAAFVVVAQNLFAGWLLLIGSSFSAPEAPFPGGEWEQNGTVGRDAGIDWGKRIRRLTNWIGIQFLVSVLYFPWLIRTGTILTGYDGNGDSPSFFSMLQRSLSAFAVGESVPAGWRRYIGLFIILLLIWSTVQLILSGRKGRQTILFLLLYLFVPLMMTWASATQRPIFNERYLIAAAPALYLLIGAFAETVSTDVSVWRQRQIWPMSCALTILILFMGIGLKNYYQDPIYSKTIGWRDLADAFERFSSGLSGSDVRLVENSPDPVLWYYYKGDVEHVVLPPAPRDIEGTARLLDDLADIERIVFVDQPAPHWDDRNIAQKALAERFALIHQENIGAWSVHVYGRPSSETSPGGPARTFLDAVEYENELRFMGGTFLPTMIMAGGVLQIHLMWDDAEASLSGNEKVFLHLLDATGQIVAQQDRPLLLDSGNVDTLGADPTARRTTTNYGILIPEAMSLDAPNGPYQLIMGLYAPTLEGASRILTTSGNDSIVLGKFESIEY